MHELLAKDEPAAADVRGGEGAFVVLCEHASNRIPRSLGDLGLAESELVRHIAWDPGAIEVAEGVADRLDGSLVLQRYSRLVVDCNRSLEWPDAFTTLSENTRIPGNVGLGSDEKAARAAGVWAPFHDAVDHALESRIAAGLPTALVTIHSFEPVYRGVLRPWDIGVVFDEDRRLADIVLQQLRQDSGLSIGINQPYSPADRVYYTVDRHATPRRLPAVMIEIRNDIIADKASQQYWAEKLASILGGAEIDSEPAGGVLA